MGLFKKIKEGFFEPGLVEELADHLNNMGIRAVALPHGSAEAIHHTPTLGVFGNPPLGSVKIEGRNVDFVEIYRSFAGGRGRNAGPGGIAYGYSYVVKANLGSQHDFKTHVRLVKSGLIIKKVVGFTWEGETFANTLNSDDDLKTKILEIGTPVLFVNANKKSGSVSIASAKFGRVTTVIVYGVPAKYQLTVGRKAFPTPEAFEVYDRIAGHVKEVLKA